MNKRFRILACFTLAVMIYSHLFAQTDDETDFYGTAWYISQVSGKTNKVGKNFKGPFNDKETTIANWFYFQIPANGKYGIIKSNQFVTKNPIAFYRNVYEKVEHEFEFDRDLALTKYNITPDPKIEKTYEKSLKKGGVNVANEGSVKEKHKTLKRASDVNPEIATLDENNTNYEVEKTEEPAPVPEPFPVEVPATESALLPISEPSPAPEPVSEPVVEVDMSGVLEEMNRYQVQRYTKEYLQDYMIRDEEPTPEDTYSVLQEIKNPDEADSFGQTLLMKAAKAGNDWQIKILLNAGANVNLQDNDGWTALMYAVRYQEGLNSIELLLKAGADIKIKNNYDLSALILAACYNNNPQLIQKLLEYYSISDKEVLQSFVLLLSTNQTSEYIQIAKINTYLDKSIPLNNFYDGKTPLMYAAEFGNSTKVLKKLMENGAATSLRSTTGKTAFEYANENQILPHDEIYWSLNRK